MSYIEYGNSYNYKLTYITRATIPHANYVQAIIHVYVLKLLDTQVNLHVLRPQRADLPISVLDGP